MRRALALVQLLGLATALAAMLAPAPRTLLEEPAQGIARFNPLSYIADGMRDPIISSITWSKVLEGLAASVLLAVVFGALSIVALRGRLRDA